MTKKTKLLATTLASVMALSGLAACVGSNNEDALLKDKTVLNICMPDLGYGTDWMKAVANGFTQKTGTRVNVKVTPTESGYTTAMSAGKAPYDIYLLRQSTYGLVTSNAVNMTGNETIIANLDDLYNSQVGNETKVDGTPLLFKEKMKDVYESYNRIYRTTADEQNNTPHYYAVQWCDSAFSLVRNMKVWKDSWNVPNTTDELLALSAQIKNEGATPFIWSSQASYWWAAANIWVTQYQGLEDMYGEQGFWAGYSEDGEKNSPNMWRRQGLLESLKVLDELVKAENAYQHVLSTSVDFTTAQGYFLIEENNIAMMANGDWLYNEMEENYPDANIEMMRMPVISAIRNLSECATIESDAELSALIDAIDAGSTALSGTGYSVSQEAYNKVYEARKMYTCSSNINHIMVSPSDSDSLDIVKDFYLYMATEEGQTLFATGGAGFSHIFETGDAVRTAASAVQNDFVKSSEAIKADSEVAPWPIYTSRLFSMGGMPVYPTIELGYQFPELIFSLQGDGLNVSGGGYMTASELWVSNYNNARSKWSSYMSAAGLS